MKPKVEGVVVGISGGVDGATTAFLAVKALGGESPRLDNTILRESRCRRCKTSCETLGIDYKIINIKPIVDAFE